MPRKLLRTSLSVLAVLMAASACGSDSPLAPSSQDSPHSPNTPNTPVATLEQAFTELSLPFLAAAGGSATESFASAPLLAMGRCAYDAASQSFVCTPVTASGITIGQRFTLLTATGAKQSAFDPVSTASVKSNTTLAGTVVEDASTLSIDSQAELTLSGLLTGPHTLDGASTAHYSGTLFDDASLDITITGSIENVVLPASMTSGANVWPASGTIIVESSGTLGDLPTFTSRATMTFTGTSKVTLTTTEDGIARTCQYDLATAGTPTCG